MSKTVRRRASELFPVLIASAGLHYAEHDTQPEETPRIPAAMWWGVVTLSTVRYGDVVPVTLVGKALGAVVTAPGIGMFALPAGVLGGAFVEEVRRGRGDEASCPHCGQRR